MEGQKPKPYKTPAEIATKKAAGLKRKRKMAANKKKRKFAAAEDAAAVEEAAAVDEAAAASDIEEDTPPATLPKPGSSRRGVKTTKVSRCPCIDCPCRAL